MFIGLSTATTKLNLHHVEKICTVGHTALLAATFVDQIISWLVMAGRNYRLCFIARYAAQIALQSHSFGAWPRPLKISPKEERLFQTTIFVMQKMFCDICDLK